MEMVANPPGEIGDVMDIRLIPDTVAVTVVALAEMVADAGRIVWVGVMDGVPSETEIVFLGVVSWEGLAKVSGVRVLLGFWVGVRE